MNAAETRVTMCHVVTDADLVPENHYHDHDGKQDGNVDVSDPSCAWRGRNKGQDHDDLSQRSPPVRHRRRRRRHVRAGFLLRLMDACACSSAERFSGRSSVTLSLDDVTFEDPELAPGEIITFQGQVNAAWNTSLEAGVLCEAEDPGGWEEGIGLHHSASSSKVEDGKDSEDDSAGRKGIEKQWQKRRKVCSAYFTFVALDNDGKKKVMLPPLAADSDECVRRRLIAEERRSIRFRRKDIIAQATLRYAGTDLSESVLFDPSLSQPESDSAVGTEVPKVGGQAAVVFTELVLPPHANHHGNTFGGQIMYWMVRAAEVAASRHAGAAVFVHGVDDVFFVGPSRVGDRVEVSARPVRCFGFTIEVSLAVYAYGLDSSDRRLINRAYFVLHVVGRGGGSIKDEGGGIGLDDGPSDGYVLPDLHPTTASEVAEYDRALGRRALRFERFAVRSSEFERDRLRVWTFRGMPADLCALNVKTLLGIYLGGRTWETIKIAEREGLKGRVRCGIYFKVERGSIRCKVTTDLPLGIEAVDVFNLLLDVQRRTEWDGYLVSAECLENVDENNDIQRFVFRVRNEDDRLLRVEEDPNDENERGGAGDGNGNGNGDGNGCMELILLRSWRRDYSEGDIMVIANHSIQHPNAPAAAEGSTATPRAFVGSSGWIVQRRKNRGGSGSSGGGGGGLGSVSLTYIVTLGPSSSRIAKDVVLGRSELLCNNMDQIVRLLTDKSGQVIPVLVA